MGDLCFPKVRECPQPPVTLPDPYPSVRITQPEPECACSLLSALAGQDGEITTVYDYFYQYWKLTGVYDELAYTLIRIVHVEVVHLRVLGNLIVQMGGNPKCVYPTRKGFRPWTGTMVEYLENVEQMLAFDVRHERATYQLYADHAKMVKDEQASLLLTRLAQDEELHYRLFETYLSRLVHD